MAKTNTKKTQTKTKITKTQTKVTMTKTKAKTRRDGFDHRTHVCH